jgi:hypothetical protein
LNVPIGVSVRSLLSRRSSRPPAAIASFGVWTTRMLPPPPAICSVPSLTLTAELSKPDATETVPAPLFATALPLALRLATLSVLAAGVTLKVVLEFITTGAEIV